MHRILRGVRLLRFTHLIVCTVGVYAVFWAAMYAAEGTANKIVEPVNFWYFWWTTALTVGYGDLSPSTTAGRLMTPLFQLASVGIMTAMLGKCITVVSDLIGKWRRGLMPTFAKGHTLIIGDFNAHRVMQILGNLVHDRQNDGDQPSIVCAFRGTGDKNPFDQWRDALNGCTPEYHQIGADGLSAKTLSDLNIGEASQIYIVFNDDVSAIGLVGAMSRLDVRANIALLLREAENEALVPNTALKVRIIPPVQSQLAVREMEDPGTGAVAIQLLDVTKQGSIYSVALPEAKRVTYADACAALAQLGLERMQAIGFVSPKNESWQVHLAPNASDAPDAGSRLIYIGLRDLTKAQESQLRAMLA